MKEDQINEFLDSTFKILFSSGFYRTSSAMQKNASHGFTFQIHHLHVFNEYLILNVQINGNVAIYDMRSGTPENDGSDKVTADNQYYKVVRLPAIHGNENQVIQVFEEFIRDVKSAKNLKLLESIDDKLGQLLLRHP